MSILGKPTTPNAAAAAIERKILAVSQFGALSRGSEQTRDHAKLREQQPFCRFLMTLGIARSRYLLDLQESKFMRNLSEL